MSNYQPCTPHDTLRTCNSEIVHTCNGYLRRSAAAYAADCNHTDLHDSCLTAARIILAASRNQAGGLSPMQLWLILIRLAATQQYNSFHQHTPAIYSFTCYLQTAHNSCAPEHRAPARSWLMQPCTSQPCPFSGRHTNLPSHNTGCGVPKSSSTINPTC